MVEIERALSSNIQNTAISEERIGQPCGERRSFERGSFSAQILSDASVRASVSSFCVASLGERLNELLTLSLNVRKLCIIHIQSRIGNS